jgi:hypothetical protein
MVKKKRIKEDTSSSEPIVFPTPAKKSKPVELATPTKAKIIKIEKEEIIDLTGDPQYIDSADSAMGYDPDWKSSKPPSPIQEPRKSCNPRPGKYMRPTKMLGATSRPKSRGSATSSSAASSDNLDESNKHGKKRGRGFLTEESSVSSKEEEK